MEDGSFGRSFKPKSCVSMFTQGTLLNYYKESDNY